MSYPKKNTTLEIVQLSQPTHVFGQPLSSVYHASDVARIQILMKYGGIYLDNDMLVLRPLDKFLKYEMAVGWPFGEYIGTQVIKFTVTSLPMKLFSFLTFSFSDSNSTKRG